MGANYPVSAFCLSSKHAVSSYNASTERRSDALWFLLAFRLLSRLACLDTCTHHLRFKTRDTRRGDSLVKRPSGIYLSLAVAGFINEQAVFLA